MIYAPFIHTLVEYVCPTKYIDLYPLACPRGMLIGPPPYHAPYVPPKKGCNPRPKNGTTPTLMGALPLLTFHVRADHMPLRRSLCLRPLATYLIRVGLFKGARLRRSIVAKLFSIDRRPRM